jgi:hypothetical protein
VFIANILKCRPPGNRDPRPEEVAQCLPYLAAADPPRSSRTLILCVGPHRRPDTCCKTDTPLGRLRGQCASRSGRGTERPVVVTYHPSYLLRTPGEKRQGLAGSQVRDGRHFGPTQRDTPGCLHHERLNSIKPIPRRSSIPQRWDAGRCRRPSIAVGKGVVRRSRGREGIFRDCLRVGYVCRVVDLAGHEIAGSRRDHVGRSAGEAHILNLCVREATSAAAGSGAALMEQLLERGRAARHDGHAFLEVRPSNTAAIRALPGDGLRACRRPPRRTTRPWVDARMPGVQCCAL